MSWRSLAIVSVAAIAFSLNGCRVVSAPYRYLWKSPEPQPASNNSDVTNPGRPLPAPSPTTRAASRKPAKPSGTTASKPAAKKTPSTASVSPFPVAKPVPGKPGLVLNPFKSNSYIDVSGYASGSKVKDPETQKIFVVP